MNATRNSLILACVVMVICATPNVMADFTFGAPVNLGPVVNASGYQGYPCLSSDGLSLYFDSNGDLFVSNRETTNHEWGVPMSLGTTVNSWKADWAPHISADGLELYFTSQRPGGDVKGRDDIWVARRATLTDEWGTPVNAGPNINTDNWDTTPCLSQDGLTLYFTSGRYNPYHGWVATDLYVSHRATTDSPWEPSVNLGPVINDYSFEYGPALSPDGLLLLFSSDRGVPSDNSDTTQMAWFDVWMTSRPTVESAWAPPIQLRSPINTDEVDWCPSISRDGRTLFLASGRPGGYGTVDIWQAPIIPIVDFNADGKVDAADMSLLVENWGLNEPLCDIAPYAWGDGVVDEKDLMVLMAQLMTPTQNAADVPCDVILNWIGPSFADSYDVYFGTSFDDVNNAMRDDPCGVLVSEGQTETACDPEGLLEFSQTYYWRVDTVDVVVGSLVPTIFKGPVLSFTTEAFVYPIQNISTTASSSGVGTGPEKTVDGSGLDEDDGHSTDGKDMWLSGAAQPRWIAFEFDQVYTLYELWVWNSNQLIEPGFGFGARNVTIEYSADGTTWTTLDGVPEFAKAPGEPSYKANTTVSFGGVSAKYVRLTINTNWGVMPQTGLSEVRFFYIPARSWTLVL